MNVLSPRHVWCHKTNIHTWRFEYSTLMSRLMAWIERYSYTGIWMFQALPRSISQKDVISHADMDFYAVVVFDALDGSLQTCRYQSCTLTACLKPLRYAFHAWKYQYSTQTLHFMSLREASTHGSINTSNVYRLLETNHSYMQVSRVSALGVSETLGVFNDVVV